MKTNKDFSAHSAKGLRAIVGNAVVGNASKRCNQPTVVVGNASKRCNIRNVTLGGVTHYNVTLGSVTPFWRISEFASSEYKDLQSDKNGHNLFLSRRGVIALQMLILAAAGLQIRLSGGGYSAYLPMSPCSRAWRRMFLGDEPHHWMTVLLNVGFDV